MQTIDDIDIGIPCFVEDLTFFNGKHIPNPDKVTCQILKNNGEIEEFDLVFHYDREEDIKVFEKEIYNNGYYNLNSWRLPLKDCIELSKIGHPDLEGIFNVIITRLWINYLEWEAKNKLTFKVICNCGGWHCERVFE